MNSKKEHDPDDKITKMTACSPGDEGTQLWEDALDKFFCGNAELIAYFQKVIGLAAIGKVFNEHIIIAYGGGANGKSTFCNAVARTLGSYSRRMAADLLTTSAARNARPELAELRGARLVLASELEEGKRMNTAMLKQLASTDDISAEKKYRDPMNFTPSHSLILQTNHLPKVGANDDGTWRRIIVIPFDAQIQAGDDIKNYSDYLAEHAGPYILKWIMEGAKNVIDAGFDIPVPDCVKAATDAYRKRMTGWGISWRSAARWIPPIQNSLVHCTSPTGHTAIGWENIPGTREISMQLSKKRGSSGREQVQEWLYTG